MADSAELVDLAETEGATEFSPQVIQFFFNIIGFFMGFLEVKPEIFRTFLEQFRKDF